MSTPTDAETRKDEATKEGDLRKRRDLVQSSPGLMPYGTPQELAEMVGRVRFMLPGGKRLADNEIWALAQNSFALGLNPLIGECWWIPGLGFMPGIKGLRRKGREQLERQDMRLSTSFKPILTKKEYEDHKIPLGALAYKCKGFNSLKRHEWVEDAKILRDALGPEASHDVILDNIGPMPLTVGIGYMTIEEMENLDNPRWYHVCSNREMNTVTYYKKQQRELRGKDPCPDCGKKSSAKNNRMPHDQRARKRAEAHMWKQECDLPFDIHPGGHGVGDEDVDFTVSFPGDPDAIEGTFREPEPEEKDESLPDPPPDLDLSPAEPRETIVPRTAAQTKDAFDDLASEYKGTRTHKSLTSNAGWLLSECFPGDDDSRHACQMYLTGKPSLTDFTGAELKALLDLLNAAPGGEDGKYHPDPTAAQEMKACAFALQAEGA